MKKIAMSFIQAGSWNIMRVLRLVMGAVLLIYAVKEHDGLSGAAAAFLLISGIFNAGCCGAGGCSLPQQRLPNDTSAR